jgi:hypothetical protein
LRRQQKSGSAACSRRLSRLRLPGAGLSGVPESGLAGTGNKYRLLLTEFAYSRFYPMKNLALAAFVAVFLCSGAIAATITVKSTADGAANAANCPGTGCRLRDALAAANNSDTIDFSVTGTITLNSGHLVVDKNVTIMAPGAKSLTLNGNAASRVFYIAPGKTVSISGLTITNGLATNPPGLSGGGIYNDTAALALTNCAISDNHAQDFGGGIYSIRGGASLSINRCTISGNSAFQGGGIYNSSPTGGSASVTLTNSTMSGNTGEGGGIYNEAFSGVNCRAMVNINNCTFSGNVGVPRSIGNFAHDANCPALIIIGNTILNGGSGSSNLINSGAPAANIVSSGYNLCSDAADGNNTTGPGGLLDGVGDIRNTNPNLGPLQDNGGPTLTHELLSGSVAIDAARPDFDQRGTGLVRVFNSRQDIGAYEVQPPALSGAVSTAHHGLSGPFDIDLPLTGQPAIECRSTEFDGGADGRHLIYFNFFRNITSIDVAGVSCGNIIGSGVDSGKGFVEFDGSNCNQQWVTISLSGVHDGGGLVLPSTSVTVGLLLGDTSGNGSANSTDVGQTKSQSGQQAKIYNFREDVNVSGQINSSDVSLVKLKSGTSLGSLP